MDGSRSGVAARSPLYVTSPIALGLAAAFAAGGVGTTCTWGGCDHALNALMAVGFVAMAATSLVTLLVANGLDVDSGSRRGAWQLAHDVARTVAHRVALAPLPGGVLASLSVEL